MAKEVLKDADLNDVNGGFFSADAKTWWEKHEDTINSRAADLGRRTTKRLTRKVFRDEFGFQFVDLKTLKDQLDKLGIDYSDLD